MYCKTLRLFGPNIFAKFKLSAPSKGNDWVGDLKPKIQIYILIASVTLVYYLNCPEANRIKQQLYIVRKYKYKEMKFIFPLYTCISGIRYAILHGTVSMLRTYKLYNYSGVGFFLELSLFIKMNTGCVTLPLFEKKSHH